MKRVVHSTEQYDSGTIMTVKKIENLSAYMIARYLKTPKVVTLSQAALVKFLKKEK
jgi:hypothetical protein